MDGEYAKERMSELRDGRRWRNPMHIAADYWRRGVPLALSVDPHVGMIALIEIHLNRALPEIDEFCGIFAVDERGIWFYDGDGCISDPIWRQQLIPWHAIDSLTLHQYS